MHVETGSNKPNEIAGEIPEPKKLSTLKRKDSFRDIKNFGDFFEVIKNKYNDTIDDVATFIAGNTMAVKAIAAIVATVAGAMTGGIGAIGVAAGFAVFEEVVVRIARNHVKEMTEKGNNEKISVTSGDKEGDGKSNEQSLASELSASQNSILQEAVAKFKGNIGAKNSAMEGIVGSKGKPSNNVKGAKISMLDKTLESKVQGGAPSGDAKSPKTLPLQDHAKGMVSVV